MFPVPFYEKGQGAARHPSRCIPQVWMTCPQAFSGTSETTSGRPLLGLPMRYPMYGNIGNTPHTHPVKIVPLFYRYPRTARVWIGKILSLFFSSYRPIIITGKFQDAEKAVCFQPLCKFENGLKDTPPCKWLELPAAFSEGRFGLNLKVAFFYPELHFSPH